VPVGGDSLSQIARKPVTSIVGMKRGDFADQFQARDRPGEMVVSLRRQVPVIHGE
jgi:hypothetical protein